MRSRPAPARPSLLPGLAFLLLLAPMVPASGQAPPLVPTSVELAPPGGFPDVRPGQPVDVAVQVTYRWEVGAVATGPTTVDVTAATEAPELQVTVEPAQLTFSPGPAGGEAVEEVVVTILRDATATAALEAPVVTVLATAAPNGNLAGSEASLDLDVVAPAAAGAGDALGAGGGAEEQAAPPPQGDASRAVPWIVGILVVAAVMYVAAPMVAKRRAR